MIILVVIKERNHGGGRYLDAAIVQLSGMSNPEWQVGDVSGKIIHLYSGTYLTG